MKTPSGTVTSRLLRGLAVAVPPKLPGRDRSLTAGVHSCLRLNPQGQTPTMVKEVFDPSEVLAILTSCSLTGIAGRVGTNRQPGHGKGADGQFVWELLGVELIQIDDDRGVNEAPRRTRSLSPPRPASSPSDAQWARVRPERETPRAHQRCYFPDGEWWPSASRGWLSCSRRRSPSGRCS